VCGSLEGLPTSFERTMHPWNKHLFSMRYTGNRFW